MNTIALNNKDKKRFGKLTQKSFKDLNQKEKKDFISFGAKDFAKRFGKTIKDLSKQ